MISQWITIISVEVNRETKRHPMNMTITFKRSVTFRDNFERSRAKAVYMREKKEAL